MPVRFVRTPVAFSVAAMAIVLAVGGCKSGGASHGGGHAREMGALSSGDTEGDVNALIDRYDAAMRNKDVETLDQIWADDLTFVNLRGKVLTKGQRLANIKSGATAIQSSKLSDRRVRVYGDTAVATLQVALEGQYSGQEGSGKHRVTIVLSRKAGTWQMVVVQMTPIAA